jgi:uncharacterized protein (TIGR02145 family)
MKLIKLFILFLLLSLKGIAQTPTFGNSGPITICVNGSYYLNPSTTNGTFSISNSNIATVNSSGYVTGVADGTTTVQLVTSGGTASATITIAANANPSLTISDASAQSSYRFDNLSHGPIGGTVNYVAFNGYNYSSQTRPFTTGKFRASKQLGDEAGCPYEYYIIKCDACGTVSESYSNVRIGDQVWTDKNLNVTTYSDGTTIPQVDFSDWASLTTGAWCYYENNPANEALYGKLYNWYAVAGIFDEASKTDVSQRKKLAPAGYHIPTNAEWSILSDYLGGASVAGGRMMTTGTSGFEGLFGGYRVYRFFISVDQLGLWWSASEHDGGEEAFVFYLINPNNDLFWTQISKDFGFSVRLIKDSF